MGPWVWVGHPPPPWLFTIRPLKQIQHITLFLQNSSYTTKLKLSWGQRSEFTLWKTLF